jgi:hypothetical protein
LIEALGGRWDYQRNGRRERNPWSSIANSFGLALARLESATQAKEPIKPIVTNLSFNARGDQSDRWCGRWRLLERRLTTGEKLPHLWSRLFTGRQWRDMKLCLTNHGNIGCEHQRNPFGGDNSILALMAFYYNQNTVWKLGERAVGYFGIFVNNGFPCCF